MTDQNHQRRVFVTVGIEVTALQINVIGGAEPLHRRRLLRPPHDGPDDPSGQHTAIIDFEVVAQDVGDAEKAGDGLDVDGERRRTEHHRVATLLMRPHDVTHPRVDAGRDAVDEEPLTELVELGRAIRPADSPMP